MTDKNISFSKLVATPTLNSWAQAYNAGKLFAVLSLEKTQETSEETQSLNMLGKELLEKLEKEFFTIEDKNLESIKQAISNTFDNPLEGINISFASCAFVDSVLYLFALGKGKIFVKRGEKLGLVLTPAGHQTKDVISSSGFLKEKDLIVLATDAFSEIISKDDLDASLTNGSPVDIAESLAPKVHKADNGKISSIIISYASLESSGNTEISTATETLGKQEQIIAHKAPVFSLGKYLSFVKSKLPRRNIRLSFSRKTVLGLVIIFIVIALASSVSIAVQKQNNSRIQALFEEIYPKAQAEFEEGKSLADLNKSMARDSFLAGQKIIKENKEKFPAKSEQSQKIQELSKQIEEELTKVSSVENGLDRSALKIEVQNGSGTEGAAGKAANIIKEFGYNVTSTGNADNYSYEGVTIKVKDTKKEFADLLKKDLEKDYEVKNSSSDLPETSTPDALIIIGK